MDQIGYFLTVSQSLLSQGRHPVIKRLRCRYEFDDYSDLIHEVLYNYYPFGTSQAGVLVTSICSRLDIVGGCCGYDYFAIWEALDLNHPDYLISDIEEMLIRGFPVMMSVYNASDSNEYFRFYRLLSETGGTNTFAGTNYTFISSHLSQGHYFNVTGLVYDNQIGEVYLRVSNGGEEEYIILSEYVDYVQNYGFNLISDNCIVNGIIYFEDL